MATEVIRRRVCDACGQTDDVKRYRLSRLDEEQRASTLDLCPDHGAPVERLLELRKEVPRGRKRTVTPMREVVALKRTAGRRR